MGSKTARSGGVLVEVFFLTTGMWQLYCALVLRGCTCSAVLLLGSSHTTSLALRLTKSPDHKNGNWHFPSDSKRTGGPPSIAMVLGAASLCRNVPWGYFCYFNSGGFYRGFPGGCFWALFFHKHEENKSGDKIREEIPQLKNKIAKNFRSAKTQP